jgi:hypothetical protein
MTQFQKLVIRLLIGIWESVRQVPGVANYDEDDDLIKEAEEAIK